jgi:hypothetical protein
VSGGGWGKMSRRAREPRVRGFWAPSGPAGWF